jgi:hypothetical protein
MPRSVALDRDLKELQRLRRLPWALVRETRCLLAALDCFIPQEEQASSADEVGLGPELGLRRLQEAWQPRGSLGSGRLLNRSQIGYDCSHYGNER